MILLRTFIALFLLIFTQNIFASTAVVWDGDFLGENFFYSGFDQSSACPGGQNCDPGYSTGYVNRGYGQEHSSFNALRMRLKPGLLINDNIEIKSRLKFGTFFLGGSPASDGTSQFTNRSVADYALNFDQMYLHLKTDYGKLELGRAPVHWGLGAYWNDGSQPHSRFSNNQDTINFATRLGPVKLNFGAAKVVEGRLVGSSQQTSNTSSANATIPYQGGGDETVGGSDNLYDYFVSALYDWDAIDGILGVRINKRKGGTHQTAYLSQSAHSSGTSSLVYGLHNKLDFYVVDFFIDKKWGDRFGTSHEIILIEGEIGNNDGDIRTDSSGNVQQSPDKYNTYAWVAENYWKISKKWKWSLDWAYVPGQSSQYPTLETNRFKAVFLSPAYQKGMLMFGSNFNKLGSSATNDQAAYSGLLNNSISNARYLATRVDFSPTQFWNTYLFGIIAKADTIAVTGSRYYNHRNGLYYFANESQEKFLGYEINMGASYTWTDQTSLYFDGGFWDPGNFYRFDNRENDAQPPTDIVWGTQLKLAVKF